MNPRAAVRAVRAPLRIAFRADDAGAATGITAGIVDAVRAGLVRNVSIMVPPPNFKAAVSHLSKITKVEFGLHITLNCEWLGIHWKPLAKVNKIAALVDDDGFLLSTPHDLHQRHPPLDQLLTEVRAQLAKLRSTGLKVTYLDEHMGVGWLPGFHAALQQLAADEGLLHADDLPLSPEIQETLLNQDKFLSQLPGLSGTFKAICHPARDDRSTRALFLKSDDLPNTVANERARELATLTDPQMIQAFTRNKRIKSITLSQAAALLNANES